MIKNRLFSLLAVATLSGATVFLAAGSDTSQWKAKAGEIAAVTRTRSVLSEVYTIDQKYRSMMGPSSSQGVRLLDVEPPELLWITGYEAVMVGPDGHKPRAQEFMCHSNLDIDLEPHKELIGDNRSFSTRLFTLSQKVENHSVDFGVLETHRLSHRRLDFRPELSDQ